MISASPSRSTASASSSSATTADGAAASSSTAINPQIIRWFEGRGIGVETLDRCGVYSAKRAENGDSVEPDPGGNIIAFPFVESGRVVAEKYRAAGKRFWQKAGGRKTFFNSDVLADPALKEQALVIVEGEVDCLSVIEAGYPFVVSVPDGAPPARDKDGNLIQVPDGVADIDPEKDEKFRCIFNNWDRLKAVKRIVIAVDNDEPGVRLAAELVRRLGRVRCSFVAFPDGCKDLNDVLVQHGGAAVTDTIFRAKPYPVSGVYRLSDLPAEPELNPISTGWGRLDEYLMLYHPALMVVTGLAGGGKSTWTNQLAAQVAKRFGWNFGIASFEMRIRPFVTDTLTAAYLGREKGCWHEMDIEEAERFIENRFTFIAPSPDDDSTHDVDWLLERAEAAVIRYGMRCLIVDPWNEIEHSRRRDETLTEYTGRAIRELKKFGRNFDCTVIVVAHPTKSGAEKQPDRISLYDISDSSHFANKADLGVVIARQGDVSTSTVSSIMVKKVRYQPTTGRPGVIDVTFDRRSGLFSQ